MAKECPPFWCDVCSLDLQSEKSLAEHRKGRKHIKREYRTMPGRIQPVCPKYDPVEIDEEGLFQGIASGSYQNIVIVTGAGASTAAGVMDFRSPGGLFDVLHRKFGDRFPWVYEEPERILSRSFANTHSDIFYGEVHPLVRETFYDLKPTLTHRFCAWLQNKGWLRRVYTSNIDGLHLHESLDMPPDLVVESHGALRDGSIVMYGDKLPSNFFEKCDQDFPMQGGVVDLLIVFGSSLQVAPFCALPNMAPRGCVRVLVNRDLSHCLFNNFSPSKNGSYQGLVQSGTTQIGKRKNVPLRPLWSDRAAYKKWSQLLVENDCDAFVEQFSAHLFAVGKDTTIMNEIKTHNNEHK